MDLELTPNKLRWDHRWDQSWRCSGPETKVKKLHSNMDLEMYLDPELTSHDLKWAIDGTEAWVGSKLRSKVQPKYGSGVDPKWAKVRP